MMTLSAEALQVVDMRLRQMAAGKGTADEVFLTAAEKIDAAAKPAQFSCAAATAIR